MLTTQTTQTPARHFHRQRKMAARATKFMRDLASLKPNQVVRSLRGKLAQDRAVYFRSRTAWIVGCPADQLPIKINEPAFVFLSGQRQRMLMRTPHARTGRYGFNLRQISRSDVQGFALICLDEKTSLAHVVLVPTKGAPSCISFTAAEARQQAVMSFRYKL